MFSPCKTIGPANINTKVNTTNRGVAASGYDVVSDFNGTATLVACKRSVPLGIERPEMTVAVQPKSLRGRRILSQSR